MLLRTLQEPERLARLIDHKELTEFIEIAAGDLRFQFQVEELPVEATAPFAGASLRDRQIRTESGVLVLAIHHADRVISAPPQPSTMIRSGDILVSFGTQEQLDVLRELARGNR